jgi:hypothetical protein
MSKTSAKQRIEQLVSWIETKKKSSKTRELISNNKLRDVKPTNGKINTYTRDRN